MRDITIHKISPELFQRLKEAALGLFEGKEHADDKEIEVRGVRATYAYDANANSLTVSVISTPDIVTTGYALGQLYDTLERLGAKPPGKT
jgi:hypothetical protein